MAAYSLKADLGTVPDTVKPEPCATCGHVDTSKDNIAGVISERRKLMETFAGQYSIGEMLIASDSGRTFKVNWPGHAEDLAAVSRQFPSVLFVLTIDDKCVKYYEGGMEQVELRPAFPIFDRNKLKEIGAERPSAPLVNRCDRGEEGCRHPRGDRENWCRVHYRAELLRSAREDGNSFLGQKPKGRITR